MDLWSIGRGGGVSLSWNWFSVVAFMDLCLIGGGNSASRSAKFGAVLFKASLLKWGGQSVIDPCHTITPSPCQLTIDPCYTIMTFSCQSTIDPCYTVTPMSLPKYLCIMLYVKPMSYSGLPCIYGQLEEGISVSWNWYDVVVCHGSVVNWRRGGVSHEN